MKRVEIGDAVLYCGDCLEILPTLSKVDAVVTDPPYGINTKSDGSGKLNPWADLCNSAFWYAEWMNKCRSLLSAQNPTGYGSLWTFLNWRSLVTFQKAACDIAWPIESLMVWDKQFMGTGGMKGLRPSYELVALFCNGEWGIKDRGIPDIQRFRSSTIKPSGHPAEKPIEALNWICGLACDENQTVLDLFMGSGTTGVACVNTGRKFVGIEIDERHFDKACKRIDNAHSQGKLF